MTLKVDNDGSKITLKNYSNIVTSPAEGFLVEFETDPSKTTVGSKDTITIECKLKGRKSNNDIDNSKRNMEIVA